MVTTRRGARSATVEAAASMASPAKRKRGASAASELPQPKRRRQVSDAMDSIEVQGEDDDVDAAIDATNTRRRSTFEILLPSVRRPPENDDEAVTRAPPSERSTSTTTARPLGTRRLKRHIHSVEITGGPAPRRMQTRSLGDTIQDVETPQIVIPPHLAPHRAHAAAPTDEEAPAEYLGSPELQSSALRRRPPARPSTNIYDIPEDEDSGSPSPAAVRRARTINGLELRSRARAAREQAPALPTPQQSAGISSIRGDKRQPVRNAAASRSPHSPTEDEGRELARIWRSTEQAQGTEEAEDQEESQEGEDTEAELGEGGANVSGRHEFPGIQARPYVPSEPTIAVFSDHLNNMSELMGRRGWTGAGRRWRAQCCMLDNEGQPPALTRLGRRLFRALSLLKDEWDEIPNAMDLVGQSQALVDNQEHLRTAMARVDEAVRKIESRADLPEELVEDLSTCLIPMLVLALRYAFAIGAKEPDAVVTDRAAPEGVFTWTTVQYLMFTLGWASRLHDVLTSKMSQQADDDANSPADQPQDPENEKQNRERFGVMVKKWKQQLKEVVRKFNEQVDAIRDRQEKQLKDARIRAARQQAEEEEFARARQQEAAFASSIQEITSRPRPMAEKFRKALQEWAFPLPLPSSRASTATVTAQSTPGTQSRPSRSSSSASSRPRPVPAAAAPPPWADYAPWPEDEVQWFLGELNRPDRLPHHLDMCAETLERPLEEVRMEKERLRRLGLSRSPGR